jgi:NADH:ubiquinone oxidoreductase subunit
VDYDGSMIPAEWFGWMHHKTDAPPSLVSQTSFYPKSNK